MTIEESKTAFAVIANWRGASLSDDERAAWKNQLLRMDFDEFSDAIENWGRGEKSNLRPSLSDLWFLIPRKSPARQPDFAPKDHEPRTPGAIGAMEECLQMCAQRGIGRRAHQQPPYTDTETQ